jgi:hypothetical protein
VNEDVEGSTHLLSREDGGSCGVLRKMKRPDDFRYRAYPGFPPAQRGGFRGFCGGGAPLGKIQVFPSINTPGQTFSLVRSANVRLDRIRSPVGVYMFSDFVS